MTMPDLMLAQATDPFRIGLMAALVWMTFRQRGATGLVLPLLLGVGFFAILLASVTNAQADLPIWQRIVAGVVVNAGLVAVIGGVWAGVWMLIARSRR